MNNIENGFVEFEPIGLNSSPSKEEISQYYLTNNITLDNDFLNDYLGLKKETSEISFKESNNLTSNNYDVRNILGKYSKRNNFGYTYKSNIPDIKNEIVDEIKSTNYSDEDKEFLIKLAKQESNFNPYITNRFGYYGLYQFGSSALQTVGMTKSDFNNTKNQHEASLRLAKINEENNKDLFKKYIGTKKNGILITRNGLRAASHLLGVKGVREWLEGGNTTLTARRGHTDANGTGPETYLKLFI